MKGKIIGIIGPMFSGKTTTLMREYDKTKLVGIPIIFKPKIDDRYGNDEIVTHDKEKRQAINCSTSNRIFKYLCDNKLVTDIFIDEVQFFDDDIIEIIDWFRLEGKNVYFSGLNQDYLGKPFYFKNSNKNIGELLCMCDDTKHLSARCSICGEPASKTHLKNQEFNNDDEFNKSPVLLGNNDTYEARCYKHHNKD